MRTLIHMLTATTAAVLALTVALPAAWAKDYMVVANRPDNLHLIDLEQREVVNTCELPGEYAPAVIVMSPDKRIAYVLNHRWENVYGIEVDSCDVVFKAEQSHDNVRVKSFASLAVSPDGEEIYTIQNPTRMLSDRYQVMEPRFAVYRADAGMDAEPVRTYPAPRRVTVMATDDEGMIYMAGHDIYKMNPDTGERSVAIANASWDRPTYGRPDVLAFWPIGTVSDEFLLMYTAPKFTDESMSQLADFVWGYSRVDLNTGDTEIRDFASFQVLMFTAVTHPENKNILYGVYTQLSKHDVRNKKLLKRVELDHTYYCVNISTDGSEVYVGGTNDDIAIYDSDSLERLGTIELPEGGDMGTATVQVFSRSS